MDPSFAKENQDLQYTWDRYEAGHLDRYLVKGVEDPRINIQSILNRAYVIDTLWPDTYTGGIYLELRYGTILTWLLKQIESGQSVEDIRGRIQNNDVPSVVRETGQWLQGSHCPFPDFIELALDYRNPTQPEFGFSEWVLSLFCDYWKNKLSMKTSKPIHVLEVACGSANDYRYLVKTGLADLLQYTGMDISAKNIANAKKRFPEVAFIQCSILENGLQDKKFHYAYVFDLFEHLSPRACLFAMDELIRVTCNEIWIHLFNAHFGPEDLICKKEFYYWNALSVPRLQAYLTTKVKSLDCVVITDFLHDKFGFDEYYNPHAVMLHVTV
ncbi:methyltransferase domain-containing protein [bacterium]|nr:methyltransferase domain-containing protein [bacterium]